MTQGIGARAIRARLEKSGGLITYQLEKRLMQIDKDAFDARRLVKSSGLHYDPARYRVKGYPPGESTSLKRLIHTDAKRLADRYADRPDWRGVNPLMKQFAQGLARRLTKANIPFHVQEAKR